MLLIRKKMPISIRFRLHPVSNGLQLLQYMITVGGKQSTRMGLTLPMEEGPQYIRLNAKEWDQKGQRIRGNSDEAALVNEAIDRLRTQLRTYYNEQQTPHVAALLAQRMDRAVILSHPAPTVKSVLFRHQKGFHPWVLPHAVTGCAWSFDRPLVTDPLLVTSDTDVKEAMTAYLITMRTIGRRVASGKLVQPDELIHVRFEATAALLAQYQPQPMAVNQITAMWADNFHAWLQTQRSGSNRPDQEIISFGLAARHAGRLREMVSWLHRQKGVLRYDPLAGIKWKGYDRKPVDALDEEQFALFRDMPTTGTNATVQWWFLLMCYTGMDYPDARAYVLDRAAREVMTPDGPTIQGQRLKNGESYCVPLVGEIGRRVEGLFRMHPTGPYALSPQKLNMRLQGFFAEQIGFASGLTAKIARKTHTNLLEEQGYSLNETSQSLGHRNVSTTNAFYYRTGVRTVRQGMRRVGKTEQLNHASHAIQ